jgi:hypothetical protein
MRVPTRALIVEDIDTWVYTLTRAAHRAGASEVTSCATVEQVKDALRMARFDIAILDIGLDPNDERNTDGMKVLEAIREVDGLGTRCVLVTGWQGGDRMDLHARAQQTYGVDWAFMKEKYDSHALINKLSELLEHAGPRRMSQGTPMANLGASVPPHLFDRHLLDVTSPNGGVQTLWSLVSRLVSSVTPLLASDPAKPILAGPDGVAVGLYWSRSLASAVAVGLGPVPNWPVDEGALPARLAHLVQPELTPECIEDIRERNIAGRLWEIPGLSRAEFPQVLRLPTPAFSGSLTHPLFTC